MPADKIRGTTLYSSYQAPGWHPWSESFFASIRSVHLMLEPLSLHPLGATNLQVPSLCVGCAALGDMPGTFAYSVAEEQALATIRAIFEGPISFADTAASYGDGESERRIG